MYSHQFRWFARLALCATLPISLSAQSNASTATPTRAAVSATALPASSAADTTVPAGPRAVSSTIQRPVQPNPLGISEPQKSDPHLGAGSNVALMVVGGAGVVIGLLIGGDGGTLLALGGGVIGLVGLYRYLR